MISRKEVLKREQIVTQVIHSNGGASQLIFMDPSQEQKTLYDVLL